MPNEAFPGHLRGEEVVKLQGGDPVSLKALGLLCDHRSRREIQKALTTGLEHSPETNGAESFYNPYLEAWWPIWKPTMRHCWWTERRRPLRVSFEGVALGKDGTPPCGGIRAEAATGASTTPHRLAAIRYRLRLTAEAMGLGGLILRGPMPARRPIFAGGVPCGGSGGWIPKEPAWARAPSGLVQGVTTVKKLKTRAW